MRVAIGGISNEGCSFSPFPSSMDDFTWWYGERLLSRCAFLSGMEGIESIPLVWARAIPGGPVNREVYERFKQEFLSGLDAALPLEGVFLDMHGALFVDGMEDAEGDFVKSVRALVREDCMIAASYDLHGNLSRHVFDGVDILTAYRTAPHIDEAETRERAFRLLIRAAQTGTRPHKRFVSVPLMLPGEKTATTWEPGQSLYRQLSEVCDGQDIWDASILIGYAWADEPRTGASIVVYGEQAAKVEQIARGLAVDLWSARHSFQFGARALSVEEAVQAAQTSTNLPVFISDAGDNITGGGVGDGTTLLEALIKRRLSSVLVASIVDAAAVTQCWKSGTETVVSLSVGGKLDPKHSKPLSINGRVIGLHWLDENNRLAILQAEGITLILTERRTAFLSPQQFERINVHLDEFSVVALKLGYLSPEFSALAGEEILALSPGVIDQALETVSYTRVRRPIFPLDPSMSWTLEDS